MILQIDDAFIREWHTKYERIEGDDEEYERLVDAVAREMKSMGTISKKTFLDIWSWKGAMRVIGLTTIYVEGKETVTAAEDQYETRYAPAFRRAASAPPERKLAELLADRVKLPGVGAPTGSTLLHFIHPDTMPIIDVRTVETLFAAGLISTELRELETYEEYRRAIDGIGRRCPGWTLREIDRALFAYHKQVLGKKGQGTGKSRATLAPVKATVELSPSGAAASQIALRSSSTETQLLKEFRGKHNEKPYQDWIAKHPHGFVANCWQKWDRGYMLHRADCYTLLDRQEDNPTVNTSAKICAMTEAELDAYAGVALQRCSACMRVREQNSTT
jgi:hypothetical protein